RLPSPVLAPTPGRGPPIPGGHGRLGDGLRGPPLDRRLGVAQIGEQVPALLGGHALFVEPGLRPRRDNRCYHTTAPPPPSLWAGVERAFPRVGGALAIALTRAALPRARDAVGPEKPARDADADRQARGAVLTAHEAGLAGPVVAAAVAAEVRVGNRRR